MGTETARDSKHPTTLINILPLELLQHIFNFFIASPEHARQIIILSHVSVSWRSVMFGMPKLFISPDWINWTEVVIADWTNRAGTRYLHAHLTQSVSPHGKKSKRAHDALIKRLPTLTPFMHRICSLRIDIIRSKDLVAARELLSGSHTPSFPTLKTLIVRSKLYDPAARTLQINLTIFPVLNILYIPNLSLEINGSISPTIKTLGWRVLDSNNLRALAEALTPHTSPLHLTIFAHETMEIRGPFASFEQYWGCWLRLTSLRLHGLSGRDSENFGSLLSQLHASKLQRLELVDIDQLLLISLITNLPSGSSCSVEFLLIAPKKFLRRELNSYLSPLTACRSGSQELLSFPNLREFVICDPYPTQSYWEVDLVAIEAFVLGRRGILEQLFLPSSLKPLSKEGSLSDHKGAVAGSPRDLFSPLTPSEESKIRNDGRLDSVGLFATNPLSHSTESDFLPNHLLSPRWTTRTKLNITGSNSSDYWLNTPY
ncbi:hypothetical protein DL93DRAFT_159639 [Clavulina sp. PMI_390]|nr:hypothetical protein DL93DRAFT_159639 [Clavulina sp. PMI_390]